MPLPNLNIVYIADQENAPYGDKTPDQLNEMTFNLFKMFRNMEIKDVLIACNTLCCVSGDYVKGLFPEINIQTIIEPTYNQLKGNDYKTINVLATNRTIDTHVYGDALSEMFPNAEIKATKIVPIVENGYDTELLRLAIQEYCSQDADAWILGCTHYPLIRPFIQTKGQIYDSILPIVKSLENVDIQGEGKVTVYTTKDPESLKQSIHNILGCEYDVQYINLKQS